MTTTQSDGVTAYQAPSAEERPPERQTRRPTSSSSKFAPTRPRPDGVEATLQEQLADGRYTDMRADMAAEYIDNLAIPAGAGSSVPGYRLVPVGLARELGVAGFEEGDPLEEIDLDEPTTEPTAAVDGNIVATFVDGIQGQHLFDVLNCGLLAQLAANVKYDREAEPIPWTKYYSRVLENIGWVVPEFTFFGLRSQATRFSMDSAVLKVIAAIMTQQQTEIVKAGFEALQALHGDDRRLTIFRRNSVENNAGNFQINGAGESAQGIVSLKLCAFNFKTDEAVTDVLWFRFNSGSTRLAATRTTLVLNDQVHERLRQPILTKLGNRGLDFIAGLDIGQI